MPVAPRTLIVFPWVQGHLMQLQWLGDRQAPLSSTKPNTYSFPYVGLFWLTVVCLYKELQQVKGLKYCIKYITRHTVQRFTCARSAADGLGCDVATCESGRGNVANTVEILAL